MQYSTDKSLFFIHIPKCAGLSVIAGLSKVAAYPWDDMAADLGLDRAAAEALVSPFGFEHEILGRMHPAHIPTTILYAHFPALFARVQQSCSFAVLRNPRDRFLSALAQRLREFKGLGATDITPTDLRREAGAVADWLSGREIFCDLEHIHFSRQCDYVEWEGEPFVKHCFAIENLSGLNDWLTTRFGIEPANSEPKNQTRQVRKGMSMIKPVGSFIGRHVLTRPMRRLIYPLWLNSGVFRKSAEAYATIDLGSDLEAFVASYYSRDAMLHTSTVAKSHS